MSDDRRERILVRLVELLEDLDICPVDRNVPGEDETRGDIIVVYDGDEEIPDTSEHPKRVPAGVAQLVTMIPGVWVSVATRADDVGTRLNAIRAAIVKAVCLDAGLKELYEPHGQINYRGMQSSLHRARSVQSQQYVIFGITYAMFPHRLTD